MQRAWEQSGAVGPRIWGKWGERQGRGGLEPPLCVPSLTEGGLGLLLAWLSSPALLRMPLPMLKAIWGDFSAPSLPPSSPEPLSFQPRVRHRCPCPTAPHSTPQSSRDRAGSTHLGWVLGAGCCSPPLLLLPGCSPSCSLLYLPQPSPSSLLAGDESCVCGGEVFWGWNPIN